MAAAEFWDGERWNDAPLAAPAGQESGLRSVVVFARDDAWAVGSLFGSLQNDTLAMHWDGTQWTVTESVDPGNFQYFVAVDGISSDDLWAVGQYTGGTLVEHWNGSAWRRVASPNPAGYESAVLTGVAAVSRNDVWAVGYAYNSDGTGRTLIERWNGRRWRMVAAPSPGPPHPYLFGVSASSASDAWAVGERRRRDGGTETLALHWDGSSWTVVPTPSPGAFFDSLASVVSVTTTDAWAVGGGYRDQVSDPPRTLTMRWDGQSWRLVPSPSPPHGDSGVSFAAVDRIPRGGAWAVGARETPEPDNEVIAITEHFGVSFCEDGRDNDGDGASDDSDPGCGGTNDGSELGTVECDDGLDNDGDGRIDFDVNGDGDAECTSRDDDDELLPLPTLTYRAEE